MLFPSNLFSGYHGACHCQGIAVDTQNGYVYYSFTTKLVKSDLQGNIIGSVGGLIGHLGCIDYCRQDGRVWGSLEFKNDVIGRGIRKSLGMDESGIRNGFYCVIFDVSKIDRLNMDAEKDGIMRAVFLPDVLEDYEAVVTKDGQELQHKYACSGIDGLAFGPAFDDPQSQRLHICYGVYGDVTRDDNDYQVVLAYDYENLWDDWAQPLNQDNMHQSGVRCRNKYFVYTGNTEWGVQNLEYDPYTQNWLMAVYRGKKSNFPNYPMYMVDGQIAPAQDQHSSYGEDILRLTLADSKDKNDIRGNNFPHGSTGVYAFGNGYYYFSEHGCHETKGQFTNLRLYRHDAAQEIPFVPVNEPLEFG